MADDGGIIYLFTSLSQRGGPTGWLAAASCVVFVRVFTLVSHLRVLGAAWSVLGASVGGRDDGGKCPVPFLLASIQYSTVHPFSESDSTCTEYY